jgi:mannosyltransferase OCH1-like enzyme
MLFVNKYRDKTNAINEESKQDINNMHLSLTDAKKHMNHIHHRMETTTNPYQINQHKHILDEGRITIHSNAIGRDRFRLIKSQPLPLSNGQYTYSSEVLEREYLRKSNIRITSAPLIATIPITHRDNFQMNMNSQSKPEQIIDFELFENKHHTSLDNLDDDHSDDDDSDSDSCEINRPNLNNKTVQSCDTNNKCVILDKITPRPQTLTEDIVRDAEKTLNNINILPKIPKVIDNAFDPGQYIHNGLEVNYEGYISTADIEIDIPLICYTTWHTHNIPPKMRTHFDRLCKNNLDIQFELFDEIQCREFISQNFEKDVLDAYDRLSPSSYKSDLWRYCVLYRNGGIYMDIKYETVNGFCLKDICDKERFVLDRPGHWDKDQVGLYTALIVSKPRNKILRACIQRITHNTENYYYGSNALYPTGPGMLGQIYFDNDFLQNIHRLREIEMFHRDKTNEIVYKNTIVMKIYDGYREEQLKYQNNMHYSKLWEHRAIYHMNIRAVNEKTPVKINSYLPRICCIVHIGSYHIFQKMKSYIDNLVSAQYDAYNLDIFFNVVDTVTKDEIRQLKKQYQNETIIVSENYGFDIGSFFHTLEHIKQKKYNYDFILKIHTKTNNKKRDELLEPLLGSIQVIRDTLIKFESNKQIGLIASKKARCIDSHVDFTRNQIYLQQLMKWYFNETTNVCKQPYVSGTMFWIRFSHIEELFMKYNLANIYNSFNNIHTFDWNWYYYANSKYIGGIPLHREKLYDHYIQQGKTQRLSGNIFHAIKYDTNSISLRDGMIEHAYERFLCYAIHRLGSQMYFVTS